VPAGVVAQRVLRAVEPAAEEEGLVAGDAERHRLPPLRAGHWCRSCVLPKTTLEREVRQLDAMPAWTNRNRPECVARPGCLSPPSHPVNLLQAQLTTSTNTGHAVTSILLIV